MVLDDKGAAEAEGLCLDIVGDPLVKTLAAVGQDIAGFRPLRLGAAEQSKLHDTAPAVLPPKVSAGRRYAKYRNPIAAITTRHDQPVIAGSAATRQSRWERAPGARLLRRARNDDGRDTPC